MPGEIIDSLELYQTTTRWLFGLDTIPLYQTYTNIMKGYTLQAAGEANIEFGWAFPPPPPFGWY
jgi:hypothetical protein